VSRANIKAGVTLMSETTKARDAWITRVIGYRFSPQPSAPFDATRPTDAPSTAMTGNLLAMIARAAPGAPEELLGVLSGMIPRFMLAIQNEPHMEAQPLSEGAPVPAQDQVLTVADSLNAALRSARRWEELLDQAEQADREIDEMEAADRVEAQQATYEQTVASYNATRSAALAEQARCMELVDTLAAEFRATQRAAPPQNEAPR
jgi:hypothetical protein